MNATAAHPQAEQRHIPRTLLEPHPDNRKHFDADALAELREDIRARGVVDDLLVRPIAGRDGSDGRPLFQILSGERRWRASEGTPSEMALPCKVRDVDDLEALEILLIPNIQRENLHPLDEAMGYERLLLDAPAWVHHDRPRLHGYTIDVLATKVHKTRQHIVARLRLLGLTPAARHAFYERDFGIASALQIARLNTQDQEEIILALKHDAEKGAAWTADTVSHTCRERYMLRLAGAPFDLADAELVPAAGSCNTCHKRSGVNPELFDDIAEGDTCADRACFRIKCSTHVERAIAAAKERQQHVITGDEAARLLPAPDGTVKGFLRLDRPSEFALSNKPLRELVVDGNDHNITLIARSLGGDTPTVLVEVMPTPYVRKLLSDKGLLKRDEAPSAAPARERKSKAGTSDVVVKALAKAEREAAPAPAGAEQPLAPDVQKLVDDMDVIPRHVKKIDKRTDVDGYKQRRVVEVRAALIAGAVAAELAKDDAFGLPSEGLSRLLLEHEYYAAATDTATIARLAGIPEPTKALAGGGDNWIWSLTEEQATRALLLALVFSDGDLKHPERDAATVVADVLGVGITDLQARAERIVSAKLAAQLAKLQPKAAKPTPPAKKATAKKVPAKSKPAPKAKAAVKYRNANTGETWSGRGLQPRWLKVALANGKTLADFDIAAQAVKAHAKPALSPEAAWPFPTGSDSTKITALQLDAARTHVITAQRASISSLQRALTVGYGTASKILEQLEQQKVVGPMDKEGQRKVLATFEAARP